MNCSCGCMVNVKVRCRCSGVWGWTTEFLLSALQTLNWQKRLALPWQPSFYVSWARILSGKETAWLSLHELLHHKENPALNLLRRKIILDNFDQLLRWTLPKWQCACRHPLFQNGVYHEPTTAQIKLALSRINRYHTSIENSILRSDLSILCSLLPSYKWRQLAWYLSGTVGRHLAANQILWLQEYAGTSAEYSVFDNAQ